MKILCKIIVLFIFFSCIKLSAQDYLYILDDKCIQELITMAEINFNGSEIQTIRDSRGILLRFSLENPMNEITQLTHKTYHNSLKIKDFLAKIENPVIIEVHVKSLDNEKLINMKKWEVSTVVANNIESVILAEGKKNFHSRIKSIGYGEFLPSKNTSNNGGKYINRVDIIILCNIGGE